MLYKRGASNAQAQDEALSQQQAARASLALAQARLDKTQLRAPYDGVLGLRQVSPGDYLSAGQDIVNLEVLDPLKVDFRIPQKAVAQVQLGQTVEISVDAYPGSASWGASPPSTRAWTRWGAARRSGPRSPMPTGASSRASS